MASDEIKEKENTNNDKYPNKDNDAWYNQKGLKQEYKSVDPNIIPSINLNDFNDEKFFKSYANINEDRDIDQEDDTHWLIPGIFLVGRDPTYFVDDLISDGFTKFISLYEWGHNYKEEIMEVAVNPDEIELIAFRISDFGTRDDKETVRFIDNLVHNILTMNIPQTDDNENKDNKDDDQDNHQGNDQDDDKAKEKDEKVEKTTSIHKIYMHCLGGHGRTGLMSSLILQAIYGMESETAIKFINHVHGCRHPNESDINKGYYRMPEANVQFDQIRRLHKEMNKIYIKYSAKDNK